jgi:hypothetical protein
MRGPGLPVQYSGKLVSTVEPDLQLYRAVCCVQRHEEMQLCIGGGDTSFGNLVRSMAKED